jgi:hypothetical protein
MQRREFGRRAGIARYEIELGDRYVQLVALGIFDREEFVRAAADIELDQALIPADAVVDMDDRRAQPEFGQIADDGFRIARRAFAPALLLHAFAEQFTLGEHDQRRFGQRETRLQRRDRDREARVAAREFLP